ncbi:hypothetical protein BKA60DRAFT_635187 [Fusarium oxysporum]|nr:hypothetical protein BKA60DRAFT_635187 [Fusarium oxysporum]
MERIPRPLATQFFSFPFPVPVTKVAGKAIDDFFKVTVGLVYPFQLGFSLEKDKVKWLEIMFHDKGCKLYASANVAPANNLKPTTALWRSSKRQMRYISA